MSQICIVSVKFLKDVRNCDRNAANGNKKVIHRRTREIICNNGCFLKFGVEVGVEVSIVNALYRLRITDQLFKYYAFTRVVRSQSTLQRLLRRQI
jgi:hypothetical protein